MKLIDLTCPACNATLKVNSELSKCMCQYCGKELLVDNEIQQHNLTNGYQFGYEAEKGRLQAIHENEELIKQKEIIETQEKEIEKQKQETERLRKALQSRSTDKEQTKNAYCGCIFVIIFMILGIIQIGSCAKSIFESEDTKTTHTVETPHITEPKNYGDGTTHSNENTNITNGTNNKKDDADKYDEGKELGDNIANKLNNINW